MTKKNNITVDVLKKRLDTLLKVVRYYGSLDGVTNRCATCGEIFTIPELQCGHFIKRGNLVLKYVSINLMPQCRRCNHFLDGAQDKAAYHIIHTKSLEDFNWLVETDKKWLKGQLAPLKKEQYVQYYNYWLAENHRIEAKWNIKLIPNSWKEA